MSRATAGPTGDGWAGSVCFMPSLVAAWNDAIDSFAETVSLIPDTDFEKPSLLPGWTISDIVAHTAALESELAGLPGLPHEPDWDRLPHANDLFSRYTEIGVDARRGWTPAQVRAELAAAIAQRKADLAVHVDMDQEIAGIGGRPLTLGQQLRMRCFDIVLHEIDLRDALGMGDQRLGVGARVCMEQIADALGYVWVKKAQAAPGQTLHVVVPGWLDRWVEVGPDGRGRPCEPSVATVELVLPAMQFLRAGSGRQGQVSGDEELGRRVVAGLNVAP